MSVSGYQILIDMDEEKTPKHEQDRARLAFLINQAVAGLLDQRGIFLMGTQTTWIGDRKKVEDDKDAEGTPKPDPKPEEKPGREKVTPEVAGKK